MFLIVPDTNRFLYTVYVFFKLLVGFCSVFSLLLSMFPVCFSSFLPPCSFLLVLQSIHVFSPCLSVSLCEGDVLFQMAEVHRQIQVQLEEMVGILILNGSLSV